MILTLGRPWQHPARCWTGSQRRKRRTPAVLERWRNEFGAELVHIALELCEARRRLVLKWPEASGWIADRSGAERASSALAATYKANQLRKRGVIRVTDLMCGVGGDTAAFHRAGLEAHAIDHDPFGFVALAHNAGCAFTEQDIRNRVDDQFFMRQSPRRDASGKRASPVARSSPDPMMLQAPNGRGQGCTNSSRNRS